MVSSSPGISDLLFAVGKPPIVEEHGVLEEFPIDTPTGVLDAAQINQIVGVIAVGLFAARGANVCLLGMAEGVKTLKF